MRRRIQGFPNPVRVLLAALLLRQQLVHGLPIVSWPMLASLAREGTAGHLVHVAGFDELIPAFK